MKKTIALILARGGSKGITNKNIKNFCGLPLIGWSILQAKRAKGISDVWLSSDDEKILKKTLSVNLIAAYNLSNKVCKIMSKRKKGSIINITSLAAERGFIGNPSYQVSKAGLKQLTKALACDWGQKNIRINNVCPGYIKTPMTLRSFKNSKLKKNRDTRMILKRWGEPKDLVGPCIFLASDSSSYITGSDIFVDGGWLAKGL
mgnify:CR=1 FL=1